MPAAAGDLADCVARPMRETSAIRLLVDYTGVLQDPLITTQPELRRVAVAHIYDLAVLAIGATRDAEGIATLRGATALRQDGHHRPSRLCRAVDCRALRPTRP